MRISARVFAFARFFSTLLISTGIGFAFFVSLAAPASAQTTQTVQTTPAQQQTIYQDYRQPVMEDNVPQNNHTYTQAVVIDVLAAVMCTLVGIDPVNPDQPCLSVNPTTNKIGYAQDPSPQFGEQQESPQIGGALGAMTGMISILYTPTVSSSQYTQYLASNFGIVKSAQAQAIAPPGQDCSGSQFGYGFCGLQPIFSLWVAARDFAYAILVIAFIFLGLGVMLRYKADSKTIMTIQNQIPRVIIAILLITFSYAIAGVMIDIMWTVTYAGVNAIGGTTNAVVRDGCGEPGDGLPLGESATANLLDNPFSFANRIFLRDCNGNFNSGVLNISSRISDSFILLMHSIINEFLGWDDGGECSINPFNFQIEECLEDFGLWISGIIITLIIVITLIIALFRLWFELIKAYVTFFVFVILGPIWIVFGLIPGRPLGFEKWMRLIFANLAAFPLVAFILVFARVVVESIPPEPSQFNNSIFVPPLVGNPNGTAFGVLMALGAILIAPTIPAMIRERMGAGKNKFGPQIAAGIAAGAGVATAPAAKQWKKWNRYNSHGEPEGFLAKAGYNLRGKTPVGKYFRQRQAAFKSAYRSQQQGGTATAADFRRLNKYDSASGEKRQKLFNKTGQEVQQEMIRRDHAEAEAENTRRSGGGGT